MRGGGSEVDTEEWGETYPGLEKVRTLSRRKAFSADLSGLSGTVSFHRWHALFLSTARAHTHDR